MGSEGVKGGDRKAPLSILQRAVQGYALPAIVKKIAYERIMNVSMKN